MYMGDMSGLKKLVKKVKKAAVAPIKQVVQTVTHPVATIKADVKTVTSAAKSGNFKDPLAAIAAVTSPELRTLDKSLKAAGVKRGAALPADMANKYLSKALGTKGKGFLGNKPATIIGAIVTGGAIAAGAGAGGAGAGAATAGSSGTAATAGGGTAAATGADEVVKAAKKKAGKKLQDALSIPAASGGGSSGGGSSTPADSANPVPTPADDVPFYKNPWILGGVGVALVGLLALSRRGGKRVHG